MLHNRASTSKFLDHGINIFIFHYFNFLFLTLNVQNRGVVLSKSIYGLYLIHLNLCTTGMQIQPYHTVESIFKMKDWIFMLDYTILITIAFIIIVYNPIRNPTIHLNTTKV